MIKIKMPAISSFVAPLIIIVFWLVLIKTNYLSQTWLSGWDNLHPEFNFGVNISRSLNATWQEYQGLGLLGGMGHAADLFRQLFLWLLSFVLPTSDLRYAWAFLMLLLGPLGVYYLFPYLVDHQKGQYTAALVAALFYLFNLATVQYFYIPFETFVSFYGFFPWLLFGFISYLKNNSSTNLLRFWIISLLGTVAFYVQTLFVVYAIVIALIGLFYFLDHKSKALKPLIISGLVIISTNFFWLLPALYFTMTESSTVKEAKQNLLSTIDTQYYNAGTGNLFDIAQLKGYWFEYEDLNEEGKFIYLMESWREHFSNPLIVILSLLVFGLSLVGITFLFRNRKRSWHSLTLALFGLVFFMLSSSNPPLGWLFEWIKENLPLFGQAFRSVFTKWSIVAALVYAVGIGALVSFIPKFKKVVAGSIILLLMLISLPMFKGNLITNNMQSSFPQSYFDLFSFFKTQPKQARIAHFPVQSMWGWQFNQWGYRGSGFLWYGIEQPILDRAFDVWSRENETFYNEISTALYANDPTAFANVLNKYDVHYVLLDESIMDPGKDAAILRIPETVTMLEQMGAKKVFESTGEAPEGLAENFLKVYDLSDNSQKPIGHRDREDTIVLDQNDSFVEAPSEYRMAKAQTTYTRKDFLFSPQTAYVEILGSSSLPQTANIYPLADMYTEEASNLNFEETESGLTSIKLERKVPLKADRLTIPGLKPGTKVTVPARVQFTQAGELYVYFEPIATIKNSSQEYPISLIPLYIAQVGNQGELGVRLNEEPVWVRRGEETIIPSLTLKVAEPFNLTVFNSSQKQQLNLSNQFNQTFVEECWTRENSEGEIQTSQSGETISITTQDASACLSLKLGNLTKDSLVQVILPHRSSSGAKPHFCVVAAGEDYQCYHTDVFSSTATNKDWQQVSRIMSLPAGKTYWLDLAARPSEIPEKEWEIEYKTPQVAVAPILNTYRFDASFWADLVREQEVQLNGDNKLIIEFIRSDLDLLPYLAGSDIKNCDLFERGKVAKELNNNGITMIADDRAAACDVAALANLEVTQAYLLRLTGENQKGRSLKAYVSNWASNRSDLEVLLGAGEFDESFVLLPWKNISGKGYSLNLETRSFGRETSENRLERVALYDLPLDWITSIKMETGSDPSILQNGLAVGKVEKYGTSHYRAKVTGGQGLITLSQGYSEGWNGYLINSQFSIFNLQTWLPWLFGEELEQVKVDGWKNGFLLANSQQPRANRENKEQQVVIVYWPQYLQWFGFGLLLVTPIGLYLANRKGCGLNKF